MKKTLPPGKISNEIKPCLFCQIASREIEAKIIFEDAIYMAFLDIRPLFSGHCLLITKTHYETFTDLPASLIEPLFLNAQLLARAVQSAMKAEGTFVAINNTVSQSVPHFHLHVVPRRKGDGLRGFFWPRQKYQGVEMDEAQKEISSQFKK
jgi:histidine triad (HIT) family protein